MYVWFSLMIVCVGRLSAQVKPVHLFLDRWRAEERLEGEKPSRKREREKKEREREREKREEAE